MLFGAKLIVVINIYCDVEFLKVSDWSSFVYWLNLYTLKARLVLCLLQNVYCSVYALSVHWGVN